MHASADEVSDCSVPRRRLAAREETRQQRESLYTALIVGPGLPGRTYISFRLGPGPWATLSLCLVAWTCQDSRSIATIIYIRLPGLEIGLWPAKKTFAHSIAKRCLVFHYCMATPKQSTAGYHCISYITATATNREYNCCTYATLLATAYIPTCLSYQESRRKRRFEACQATKWPLARPCWSRLWADVPARYGSKWCTLPRSWPAAEAKHLKLCG